MLQKYDFFNNNDANQLLIFFPGMTRTPREYELLFEQFKSDQRFSKFDAFGYRFPNSYYSNIDPSALAEKISEDVAGLKKSYQNIILVGHSVGGLIARKSLLAGVQAKLEWSKKVNRLVFLSSANRGFVPRGFLQKAGILALWVTSRGKLIRDAQRGSDWINQLRVDWATTFKQKGVTTPEVVQIRGEKDEFVEADDSADLMYFQNAHEVRIAGLDHTAFCRPGLPPDAITEIKDCFFRLFEPRKKEPEPPTMLVFLVHGIRDYAEWQESLAQEISGLDPKAMVIPVQYGYFNAFQFLSPLQRNRASRIFADKFIQAKLKHPDTSQVVIAAHSNGTYAVAKAFEKYDFFKADRLYLAGSVLPRNFNITKNIGTIRNDIANTDWAVGLLCNAIKWIDIKIGTAGFHGFKNIPPKNNNSYLEGPHGAALAPPYRSEVAKYLVNGQPIALTINRADPNPIMELVSKLAVPIFLAVLAGIGYLYVFIATTLSTPLAVIASTLLTILLITGLSSV